MFYPVPETHRTNLPAEWCLLLRLLIFITKPTCGVFGEDQIRTKILREWTYTNNNPLKTVITITPVAGIISYTTGNAYWRQGYNKRAIVVPKLTSALSW
jgi:hypothetical protein